MRDLPWFPAALFVALLGLAACGDDEATESRSSEVVLSEGEACGDVYFWAASESGDVAVIVMVDARDRSTTEPTTIELALPDPTVVVEVLEGEDLSRNFCTDVIDLASEPQGRQHAVAGEGTITLGPAPEGPSSYRSCGTVSGELVLDGLVTEDGTTFAPIAVSSDSIGCYSG